MGIILCNKVTMYIRHYWSVVNMQLVKKNKWVNQLNNEINVFNNHNVTSSPNLFIYNQWSHSSSIDQEMGV